MKNMKLLKGKQEVRKHMIERLGRKISIVVAMLQGVVNRRSLTTCFKGYVCSFLISVSFLVTACSPKEPDTFNEMSAYPEIFPNYIGTTIPVNIAPMRFKLSTENDDALVVISRGKRQYSIASSDGKFLFSESEWKNLLDHAEGDSLKVKVYTATNGKWTLYKPFYWYVATEPIDPYLVYRLIEPGYELWNHMGLYQRDLTSFDEEPIISNARTEHNCMNCHTFNRHSPDTILFHQRARHGGTYIVTSNSVEKLDAKINDKFSGIVYPYWHPSGNCVVFSSNNIKQAFTRSHRNRIEVFDHKSDLVFYDVARHEIWSDSIVMNQQSFETFPCFSPDGKKLYFCSAKAVDMPKNYENVRYNLCAVDFDLSARRVGQTIDTLVNASSCKKSVSFPRVSPDGKQLVFVLSDFGNFSIWHREADLYALDMQSGKVRELKEVNSEETESYHSWSSNGRWMVFSSRRIDGLYTHPHLVYIHADGTFSHPFVIPQKDPSFYKYFMKSFNLPELVKGKIVIDKPAVWKATRGNGIKLKWSNS